MTDRSRKTVAIPMQGAGVVPWSAPNADIPQPIVSLLLFLHSESPSGTAPVAFLGLPSAHRPTLEAACRFGFILADHYELPADYTLPSTYPPGQKATRFKRAYGFTLTDAGKAVATWALLKAAESVTSDTPNPARSDRALAQIDVAQFVAKFDRAVVTIRCPNGSGSGFVVDETGVIVTNHHVVAGATEATVILLEKTQFAVDGFLACAPGKDLVLLKISPGTRDLATIHVAETMPAKGQRVFAFGAPMGLPGSVSDGMVSAVRCGADLCAMPEAIDYDPDVTLIQTTAPISPGNSGGPLVNDHGEVVGVNALAMGRGAQNLNFAISAAHLIDLSRGERTAMRPLRDLPRRRAR